MSDSNAFMDEVIDEVNTGSGKVPQFLNVLTILTFIGSGLYFIQYLYSILTLSTAKLQIEQSRVMMEDLGDQNPLAGMLDGAVDTAILAIENGVVLNSAGMIATALCIIGALFIRKLKRTGFYLYIVGCIVEVAVPLSILGFTSGLAISGYYFIGFISIVFIIMYGVNLKHLK